MKILQLITRDQLRGAEAFAAHLSGELAARGHEVTLAHLYAGPPALPRDERVARIDLKGSPRPGISPSLLISLRGLLRTTTPDVVQANGSDTLKYAVLASMLAAGDTPLLYRNISMISHWGSDPFRRRFVCALLRRVERVVSVSEAGRRDVLATCGLPESRVISIPRGLPLPAVVDREAARSRLSGLIGDLGEGPLLFHVGSHTAEKNHRALLQIFGRVRNAVPSARLVLLGEGPLTADIARQAIDDGLGGSVHLLGARSDVADLLPAADLLLLPSHVEGIPGAVLEAGAAAVPAVAYDVGGIAEVVRNGVTGALVTHGDVEGFAASVLGLLEDEAARRDMGRRAREYVVAHHSLQASADAFERLYADLVAEGHGRGRRGPGSRGRWRFARPRHRD